MEIIIKAKNQTDHAALTKYAGTLSSMMFKLKKRYKLKLPESIIFRPLRRRTFKFMRSSGIAGKSPGIGYWIALNMDYYKGDLSEGLIDTLAEEVSHLATDFLHGHMKHDSVFHEMKNFLIEEE